MKSKEIKILPVKQILDIDSQIGLASVKLTDLLYFVKYTQRTEEDEKNYQREIDLQRVKSINDYILENIYNKYNGIKNNVLGLFPSSAILAVETNFDFENVIDFERFINVLDDKNPNLDNLKLSFYENESRILKIANYKNVLIVDGQHRIFALDELHKNVKGLECKFDYIKAFNAKKRKKNLEELNDSNILDSINDFEFICTFLINFDLYQQSQVFANVNFNQKPVNKSIYYDIFGSVPDLENNDLNLAHKIVEKFKKNENSELSLYVNMLGKGKGLISQAFLIEAIRPFIKSGVWSSKELEYSEINSKYINEINNDNGIDKVVTYELDLNSIELELFNSLNSFLKIAFDKWNTYLPNIIDDKIYNKNDKNKYNHILLKTVGLGALIKFFEFPFRRVNSESIEQQNSYFERILDVSYKSNSDIFSNEKNGGASGLGTRNKVFNELLLPCIEVLKEKENFNKREQRVINAILSNKKN